MKTGIKNFKKLVALLLIVSTTLYSTALGCNFDSIQKVNGGYLYPVECHLAAGKAFSDVSSMTKEIEAMKKAITLQDLALSTANKRADMWMETSLKTQEALATYEKYRDFDGWVKFGLGFGVAFLSVIAASQLKK